MQRIQKLLILTFSLLTAIATFAQNSKEKPNILFLFADDQCHETIHALGNNEIITPNLDKMVESGVSFRNAYNMGSWSGAVCLASRAMLNSGMSVWRANQATKNMEQRASDKQLWGNLMQKAGYETYMTGKWHVHAEAGNCFANTGTVRGGMPNQTDAGYDRPKNENDNEWNPWDTKFEGYWKGGKHWTEVVGDEALGFIEDAEKKDKPFFMYVAFNAPHDPRQSPKEFVDMYPLENISVPENYMSSYPHKQEIGCYKVERKGEMIWQRDEHLAPHPRTEYSVKVNRQEYYAIITHLDEQIGRILEALKKSEKADNTYIFYTADHGLAVGHHGLIGKQNMFEHSMKPPLIVIGPDVPKNKQNEGFVYLQDIMASALDVAGVEKPDYVEFRSLMPLTKKKTKGNYSSIYGAYLNLQRMVRVGDYKLVVYPEVPKVYLFNLKQDPQEMKNLADLPEYKKKKDKLFEELVKLQQQMNDPLDLISSFPEFVK